jgi:hypothetical protein
MIWEMWKQWIFIYLSLEWKWGRRPRGKKKSFDEKMIDVDSALEKEKEEIKKIDKKFEEKTQKLTEVIDNQ